MVSNTKAPNERFAAYLESRGLEPEFAAGFRDQFTTPSCWPKICEWIKSPIPLLTLYGSNGSGKTWAAIAAMAGYHDYMSKHADRYMRPIYGNEASDFVEGRFTGGTQRFVRCSTVAIDYAASFAEHRTKWILEELKTPALLVIDDLGTKLPTGGFLDFLADVIDHRIYSGKRLIITTNIMPKSIASVLGLPLNSRIRGGQGIEMVGPDRRL